MTNLSPRTISQPGWQSDRPARLKRAIARARLVLLVERVAPALWPAVGVVALYFAAALFGLFLVVPWIVQALILAAAITATGLALENGFRDVRLPTWHEGARRLEHDSALAHRPISEADDRLLAGSGDPVATELWARHRARTLQGRLHVAFPDPDFESRDPKRLHLILLATLVASLIAAHGQWRARLAGAFDSGAAENVSLDAWVDPPPYTGVAPIYLPQGQRQTIAVPIGSVLNLRAHGADHAPGLSLGGTNPPRFVGEAGEYAATAKLMHDGRVRVRASGHRIGSWSLHVIADRAPTVLFTALPEATERDAVKFAFKASDDYGVTAAKVVIRPHGKPQAAPLTVDLAVAPAKTVAETTYSDLTGHPYAGLLVDAHLEARDGAGQLGKSKTVTFRLPARVFTDPLARALIEQRQALATAANRQERRHVADMLDALTIAPDKFYAGQPGVYAGIRAAYWGVRSAREQNDIVHVENLLWQIAMAVEQKGMLEAANSLRQLQALITEAMAEHAPQAVIDRLLQRYNQAMQRYLEAMLQNSQKAKQQSQTNGQAKTITPKDLQQMMKAIQQLAQSGNRQAAAQMLAALQNILENMKVQKGASSGQQGDQKNGALNQAIQQYGELMGGERALMDKTLRQAQGNGDPKDGGAQGLARQQQALKQKLDRTMKKLGKQGGALGRAGEAMDQAQKSLNSKDLANANNQENTALSELRKGADALAKEMQSAGNAPNGASSGREDPLGRGLTGPGNMIKLPNANDMARARDILEERRRRAGQRGRPREELDYLDRLLKEF